MSLQRVLVIDRDPEQGARIRNFLGQAGNEPTAVQQEVRADEGLMALARDGADVVFLDLKITDDGLDVLRRIRGTGNETPVVALTDPNQSVVAAEMIGAGVDFHISRNDLSPARLATAVETAAGRYERRRSSTRVEMSNERLSKMLAEETLVSRELAAQRENVEFLHRMRMQFLTNVSHEIGTPLTAILGMAEELLNDELQGVERKEAAVIIRDNSRLLQRVINDLFDLSKIESNQIQVERKRFFPHDVVKEALEVAREEAWRKGLELSHRFVEPLPQEMTSDPDRVRQILIYLLDNAIKFTEKGSVRLNVSMSDAEPSSASSRRIVFEVVDTGIGMSVEQISAIFEPFAQADSTAARRYRGSGLGLTICRRMADLLEGEIEVDSKPGNGSAFRLVLSPGLPLEQVEWGWEAPTSAGPLPERSYEILRDLPVLVADDNEVNRHLLVRILEREGADVSSVNGGEEVLELVLEQDYHPRLILMDVQMPGLDGLEVTRRLRDRGFSEAIIAITATAVDTERERSLAAGCDGFVVKPVRRADLLDEVCGRLSRSRDGA